MAFQGMLIGASYLDGCPVSGNVVYKSLSPMVSLRSLAISLSF
jgi:hypothetical protein